MKHTRELQLVIASIVLIFAISFSSAWSTNALYESKEVFQNHTSYYCNATSSNICDNGIDGNWSTYINGDNNPSNFFDNLYLNYTLIQNSNLINENIKLRYQVLLSGVFPWIQSIPSYCYNWSNNNWALLSIGTPNSNVLTNITIDVYKDCINDNKINIKFDRYTTGLAAFRFYESALIFDRINLSKTYNDSILIQENLSNNMVIRIPQNTFLTNARMNLSAYISTVFPLIAFNKQGGSGCDTGQCSTKIIYRDFYIPNSRNITYQANLSVGCVSGYNDGGGYGCYYYCYNYTSNSYSLFGQMINFYSETPIFANYTLPTNCIFNSQGKIDKINIGFDKYYAGSSNWEIYSPQIYLNRSIFSNMTNLNISINNNQIYYYPNNFSQQNNKTNNFASVINSYLSTCFYLNGFCNILMQTSVATAGILQFSDLQFNNLGFNLESFNYSSSAFETANERFTLNVSYDVNYYTSSSATLIYDGTSYSAGKTSSGNNSFFSVNIDIPTVTSAQNKSFYWNVSLIQSGGTRETYYTDIFNQTVNPIFLTLCNATNNVRYINFTFRDESNNNAMSAATDLSTWTYYLGNGTKTKELIFTNTTANPSYAFCFTPKDRSLNVVLEYYQYSANSFPQRQYYISGTLTNTTTNQVLYLLNASQGIYSTFITNNPSANVISGVTVKIYREISGSNVLISQGLTDSAGSATFWLNPNYEHTIIFSKIGYATQTLTVRPTQSVYTVIMGGGSSNASFAQYLAGINWNYYPSQQFLAPNTVYTFGLNINAVYEDIVSCKVELLDSNNTLVNSVTGCSASGGNISFEQNTGNYSKLFLKFYVDVGNGLVVLDPIDYWVDATNTSSINTIKSFFEAFSNYNSDFGASNARNTYTKFVAFFLVLTVIIAFLSYTTGADLTNPGWAVTIIYLSILLASIAGFFTIDIYNVTQNDGFGKDWINKYFVASITGLYTAGFILSRLRRESV
jgi:hypothetical protein